MATQVKLAHPVRTLHEQSKALEKSLTACLTKASPESVHKLRTTIRRFEAQFTLLAQSRKLPKSQHQPKKLLRHLRKLRRFAGEIRDIDVQRDLISAHTTAETAADAARLRRRLKERRDQQAALLVDLAQRLNGKVSKELGQLLETLLQVEHLSMPSDQVTSFAQRLFSHRSSSYVTDDQLHAARKAAKVARYICEMVPTSATAVRMAKKFEDIQDKGGQWHDWLQIAKIAEDHLETHSPLTDLCNRERDLKLTSYRRKLMGRSAMRAAANGSKALRGTRPRHRRVEMSPLSKLPSMPGSSRSVKTSAGSHPPSPM